MSELDQYFRDSAALVEEAIGRIVPSEDSLAGGLAAAMRWSLFGGGKRFRPALVLAAGRAFGAPDEKLLGTAAAVEMLHTYSLIHDDLPSMDDDDLRRGRETSHKKFGEATAILAGDALQALTFETIAEDQTLPPDVRLELLSGLGRAASCMVAGQHLDLESEGKSLSLAELETIHRNKTGALIAFSASAGARIANATEADIAAIEDYGQKIGLLFQVVDDILDITQPTETLGKTSGKDIAANKATYPSILGLDEARSLAERLRAEAADSLPEAVRGNAVLAAIPEYLLNRQT
ncbi:MAG: polyprenyl synthetase family protein [Pyrinomonadaceae bacterium]|nr:polyprenyl synthetase family protein [Pyrinomonadaceae bacterium]